MRLLLIILLSHASLFAFSQEKIRELALGTGWAGYKLADQSVSSLMYSGNTWMTVLDYNVRTEKYLNLIEFNYRTGSLQPWDDALTSLSLYRWDINWIHVRKLKNQWTLSEIYLGGHFLSAFENTFHDVWPNNSYSYHFSQSVGPSAGYLYANPDKNILLTFTVSVPVFAYVIRPGITNVFPEKSLGRNLNNKPMAVYLGGRFETIRNFQRIHSRIKGSMKIKGHFWAGATYGWDYINYKINNQTTTADHKILFSIIYKINK